MKKFFIILAAAALFAACEKEETPKEPLPEPKFSETTVMAEQKTLNINSTITDFTFVSQDATAVGVWYAAVDKEEKTEAAGTFKDGKISGSFKNLAYGEYAAGVYAEVEGKKYYSEADYACVIEHAKIDGYETVELAGNTWTKSNLHFLPTGVTASADPAQGNIWYPYDIENGAGKANTTEEYAKKYGYLYNYYSALGISKTKVNALVKAADAEKLQTYLKSFEGAQGICPDGWHMPTEKDFAELCGKSLGKNNNTTAPWFDTTYKQGKISTANELGFNFLPVGQMNKVSFSAQPSYSKVTLTTKNCSVAAWHNRPTPTTFLSSTFDKFSFKKVEEVFTDEITNVKLYGMMASFTGSMLEGGLSVLNTNIETGYSVRCVRNQPK